MAMIATTGAEPLRLGQPRLRHPYENVIEGVSSALLGLPCLVPEGGDWREPAPEASIRLDHACWVLLAVHDLGAWSCPDGWSELPHGLVWRFAGSMRYRADRIIARRCSAGELALPANRQQHRRGFWARPHLILLSDVLPDPPSPHETCDGLLAALTRVETIELRAGRLSASISTRPMLRLLAFADGDGGSLLAPGGSEVCGVRTWFMAPAQDQRSHRIASLPARVVERSAGACTLACGPERTTGLEVLWEVRLEAERGVLVLRHGLRNHGDAIPELAPWSIVAGADPARTRAILVRDAAALRPAMRLVPPDAVLGTPFSISPGPWPGSGVHDGAGAVASDAAADARPIKVALRSPSGLAALIRGDRALLSRIAAAGGTYPEGDHNLTSYRDPDIIEIEHVGALSPLATGATAWLEQELRYAAVPPGATADEQAAAVAAAWGQR